MIKKICLRIDDRSVLKCLRELGNKFGVPDDQIFLLALENFHRQEFEKNIRKEIKENDIRIFKKI